jgi:hypothetical protein
MEILINELSLCGQFATVDEFAEQALPSLLSVLKEINPANNQLFKKEDFYSSKVTTEFTLHDIFVGSLSRKYDEIRRFKSLLASLFENPFWEGDMRQSADSKYIYKEKDIWGSSLAESCERDKVVLSFKHEDFTDKLLPVTKDTEVINIDNLFDKGHYLELCWQRDVITFEDYCIGKFKGGKLDFTQIDTREGFNLIVNEGDERLFFDGFRKFSELTWQQISVDDGLDYKEFKNKNYFKDIKLPIHKYRISQKYRCFGYVDNGVFHVLMLALDHKLSDQG